MIPLLLWTAALAGFTREQIRVEGGSIGWLRRAGSGPPLVLIPGSFAEAGYFAGVAARLKAPLLIVELRGHGGSQPPAAAPTMRSLANDVLAAVEAARPGERYFVGGHSIGGMVAIEIAGMRPGDVRGVIAMEGWTHHTASAAFPSPGRMPAAAQATKEKMRARVLAHFSGEQRAAFARVWRQWDGAAILAATPVPVLELWGDRGRVERPSRAELKLPERAGIELRWVAGATHDLPLEQPEAVAAAMEEFMRRVR